MKVSIAYAADFSPYWSDFNVDEDATVASAIEKSGILKQFPDLNLKKVKIGIFGKFTKPETKLQPGDRIEIYQPIIRVLDDDEDDD
jgi:putative ubiquitin-RnfH superfamily antitoxin RatB of RatAB toxin-antitoxin module